MLRLVFVLSSHLKRRWCSSAAALSSDHSSRLFHTSQSAGRGRCSAALVVIFKKKRQSFEVPAHLKLCLTSEWSETLCVRSLRGANLTPHNSTLSLSAARGGGGGGGRGEQKQLDPHHYPAVRAERDALLTCCSNQTGAGI